MLEAVVVIAGHVYLEMACRSFSQSTMDISNLYRHFLHEKLLLCALAWAIVGVHAHAASVPMPYLLRSHHQGRTLLSTHTNSSTAGELIDSPCQTYGLNKKSIDQDQDAQHSTARVVDCFLASNELDMMEIRLRELEAVVDSFVVVESRMTFRGNPKPLRFPSLMQRLPAMVINKIIYHVIDELEGSDAWAREIQQRNTLFDVAVARAGVQPGDILLVSDCDEIPKPSFIRAMKQCDGITFPVTMGAVHHYYSFSLRSTTVEVWPQPRAMLYSGPVSLSMKPHNLRGLNGQKIYQNSSWHCSSCFSHIAAVQRKIGSFSHSELDLPEHRDVHNIVSRVKHGLDLFNRPSQMYARDNSGDMPQFIKQNPTRFSYLINRDAGDAGFWDIGMRNAWTESHAG